MKLKKTIISIILFFALILSSFILIKTIYIQEWSVVASSLAVITAIIGSWSAQRIIWKQQEDLEPNIIVYLDLKSRSDCTQFIIENIGGSTAYDVNIKWEKPLKDSKNNNIKFNSGKPNMDFTQITKGQRYTYFVGVTSKIYEREKNSVLEYYGVIEYKKGTKNRFKESNDFFITMEPYRISLNTENDVQAFFKENSFIHNDLKQINLTLKELNAKLDSNKDKLSQ
jgi:hypothetical protein